MFKGTHLSLVPSNFRFGSETAFLMSAVLSTIGSVGLAMEHIELLRDVFFSRGFGGKSIKKYGNGC